jgi:hypothetical protein
MEEEEEGWTKHQAEFKATVLVSRFRIRFNISRWR